MTTKEFIEKCCEALEVEPGSLDETSSPETVETWDSMGWLNLIALIDSTFNVTIDIEVFDDVEDLEGLIEKLKEQNLLED